MPELPLIDFRNVRIEYRSEAGITTAVKGASFALHPGEVLGIVGESGSGKTALALALMGLLPPNGHLAAGEILFQKKDGTQVDLANAGALQWRGVRGSGLAMIFQEPLTALNPVFRCGEQVAEAVQLHFSEGKKKVKERALELFRRVQLPDTERIYRSWPHQLSGGQRQRVMIAMALAGNPSVLIADEPTSALDRSVQQEILTLLAGLHREWRGSMIFISHDLGVIRQIAQRVLVMKAGELVEEGQVQAVFSRPQHPYTRQLIADSAPKRRITTPYIPAAGQGPLLKAEGLRKWFPRRFNFFGKPVDWLRAVDEVNIAVYPGETLGLVGESGSGKTTLGRTLLYLTPPSGGSVYYRQQPLATLRGRDWKSLRKDLQIIFQDPYSSLNHRLPVGEAIVEPMRVHRIGRSGKERISMAEELLRRVGLEAVHFHHYPDEFSGGQRQRICIARALALQPRFLLCDECVSALDVTVQAQVLDLLAELKQELGLTYIFISHNLEVVRSISDRIAVMKDGRIVETAPTELLFANPQHPYTRQLVGLVNT